MCSGRAGLRSLRAVDAVLEFQRPGRPLENAQ